MIMQATVYDSFDNRIGIVYKKYRRGISLRR